MCAVAPSQGVLIGARFVQGVGGALTSAVILGMIVTMFPEPREQAKAIGVYGFVASAGGSIGLLAGGVLTEAINWHWIFFINLPIGIATALLALRLVDGREGLGLGGRRRPPRRGAAHRRPDARRLHDPAGRRAGLGLDRDARARRRLARAAWPRSSRARRAIANPLMPLRLFRSRNVAGANLVQALLVVGMFGMFFLGALYLQRVLGYDPLEVGLAFLPSTIVMGVDVAALLGPAARCASAPKRDADPAPGVDRRRHAAVRAHAGRRHLRRRRDARDDPGRPRRRPRLPRADDARDVGRHAERLGPGLRPGQHERRRSAARSASPCSPRSRPSAPTALRAPTARRDASALNSGFHLAYLVGAVAASPPRW